LRDKEENVQNDKVQGIILEPTRELAMQVKDQFDKFSSVKSEVVYGGEISSRSQSSRIERYKPTVLVATPGRLLDLVQNWDLDISDVKYLILDEGDKMLDMGFEKELEQITGSIKNARGMIFSATVPLYIQKIAVESFKNPVLLDLVGTEES